MDLRCFDKLGPGLIELVVLLKWSSLTKSTHEIHTTGNCPFLDKKKH